MKLKRLRTFLILFILCFGSGVTPIKAQEGKPLGDNSGSCITTVELKQVRGYSLAPLIYPGETVKLVYGYYNCHPVERGDIIAYKYTGRDAPIIKLVKAVGRDRWNLKENKDQNSWRIMVDDKPLKNSRGEFYQISRSNIRMLELYIKSYPVLPENTYLIMGNQVSGSLDATRFGLIDKRDILGKIEFKGHNNDLATSTAFTDAAAKGYVDAAGSTPTNWTCTIRSGAGSASCSAGEVMIKWSCYVSNGTTSGDVQMSGQGITCNSAGYTAYVNCCK